MERDTEQLQSALRLLFQTIKRPQHWQRITARTGLAIDRPAAAILHTLAASQSGRCRVHDLALQLGIEAPSVTRKTQELEQAGYLQRLPDRHDRRAIDLRLTSRGRTVSRRLWDAQRALITEALTDWQPAERRQFVKLFERFSRDMSQAGLVTPQPQASRSKYARN